MQRIITAGTMALLALAMFAGAAGAAVSSQNGYSGPIAGVEADVEPRSGVSPVSGDNTAPPAAGAQAAADAQAGYSGGGGLPFTGLDVAFMATLGAALVLSGLALSALLRGPVRPRR